MLLNRVNISTSITFIYMVHIFCCRKVLKIPFNYMSIVCSRFQAMPVNYSSKLYFCNELEVCLLEQVILCIRKKYLENKFLWYYTFCDIRKKYSIINIYNWLDFLLYI